MFVARARRALDASTVSRTLTRINSDQHFESAKIDSGFYR